jgi:dihydrofolate reductase
MEIAIIVAIDNENAIGREGDQLAYISGDLKRFRQLTTGNAILMGRKTFEALPKGALPNRRNIVLTRNKKRQFPGCEVAHSIDEAIELIQNNEKLFIIGGGEIYKAFMPLSETLIVTRIHHTFEDADTWFPKTDAVGWKMSESEGPFSDEKSGYRYSFETLHKIK